MSSIPEFLRKYSRQLYYLFVAILIVLFGWILWRINQAGNLGFASKTFWDWIALLLLPITLLIIGLWFGTILKATELKKAAEERKSDREIADKLRDSEREIAVEKQQQDALEKYFDRMMVLLLEGDLSQEARPNVQRLARTLTLNILRQLGSDRNRQVMQFLQESDMLGVVNLRNGDLFEANLSGANLVGIDLSGSDLSEANLVDANLCGANLRGAGLIGTYLIVADLSGANLRGANLSSANLNDAILVGADLRDADLTKADLRGADLSGADLRGANMTETELWRPREAKFDENTKWPESFSLPNSLPK